ncbi:unnamed protein product [Cylicocyclus nassatus]|uniref:Uncharacterized protein n=1 Tax=Cylicocyclus nassatus TaxID=53992 RepID=A0AA36HGP6_CYLNA|nr:unnamed protein product [Cylicocyclus nassatus]
MTRDPVVDYGDLSVNELIQYTIERNKDPLIERVKNKISRYNVTVYCPLLLEPDEDWLAYSQVITYDMCVIAHNVHLRSHAGFLTQTPFQCLAFLQLQHQGCQRRTVLAMHTCLNGFD